MWAINFLLYEFLIFQGELFSSTVHLICSNRITLIILIIFSHICCADLGAKSHSQLSVQNSTVGTKEVVAEDSLWHYVPAIDLFCKLVICLEDKLYYDEVIFPNIQ